MERVPIIKPGDELQLPPLASQELGILPAMIRVTVDQLDANIQHVTQSFLLPAAEKIRELYGADTRPDTTGPADALSVFDPRPWILEAVYQEPAFALIMRNLLRDIGVNPARVPKIDEYLRDPNLDEDEFVDYLSRDRWRAVGPLVTTLYEVLFKSTALTQMLQDVLRWSNYNAESSVYFDTDAGTQHLTVFRFLVQQKRGAMDVDTQAAFLRAIPDEDEQLDEMLRAVALFVLAPPEQAEFADDLLHPDRVFGRPMNYDGDWQSASLLEALQRYQDDERYLGVFWWKILRGLYGDNPGAFPRIWPLYHQQVGSLPPFRGDVPMDAVDGTDPLVVFQAATSFIDRLNIQRMYLERRGRAHYTQEVMFPGSVTLGFDPGHDDLAGTMVVWVAAAPDDPNDDGEKEPRTPFGLGRVLAQGPTTIDSNYQAVLAAVPVPDKPTYVWPILYDTTTMTYAEGPITFLRPQAMCVRCRDPRPFDMGDNGEFDCRWSLLLMEPPLPRIDTRVFHLDFHWDMVRTVHRATWPQEIPPGFPWTAKALLVQQFWSEDGALKELPDVTPTCRHAVSRHAWLAQRRPYHRSFMQGLPSLTHDAQQDVFRELVPDANMLPPLRLIVARLVSLAFEEEGSESAGLNAAVDETGKHDDYWNGNVRVAHQRITFRGQHSATKRMPDALEIGPDPEFDVTIDPTGRAYPALLKRASVLDNGTLMSLMLNLQKLARERDDPAFANHHNRLMQLDRLGLD